jgi:hypothetical protein
VVTPEEWALPQRGNDLKKIDGERGPAQDLFKHSLTDMKFEFARLEGWTDYIKWAEETNAGVEDVPDQDIIRGWDADNGALEVIKARVLDARDRNFSLNVGTQKSSIDYLNEEEGFSNSIWQPSSTLHIDSGAERIINALNSNSLFVVEDCRNTIYSLKTWTNLSTQAGACKDPIDTIRWFYDLGKIDDDEATAGEDNQKEETVEKNQTIFDLIKNRRTNRSRDNDQGCCWSDD